MPSRRALLATLAATAVTPLLAGPAGAFAPQGVPGVAAALFGPRPEIRPWGKFFIVNGWVLTARDLETLGLA
jgi:hypothetical protein